MTSKQLHHNKKVLRHIFQSLLIEMAIIQRLQPYWPTKEYNKANTLMQQCQLQVQISFSCLVLRGSRLNVEDLKIASENVLFIAPLEQTKDHSLIIGWVDYYNTNLVNEGPEIASVVIQDRQEIQISIRYKCLGSIIQNDEDYSKWWRLIVTSTIKSKLASWLK